MQYCIITGDEDECLRLFPNTHIFGGSMTDKRGANQSSKGLVLGIFVFKFGGREQIMLPLLSNTSFDNSGKLVTHRHTYNPKGNDDVKIFQYFIIWK